jgi:hypothetical protein
MHKRDTLYMITCATTLMHVGMNNKAYKTPGEINLPMAKLYNLDQKLGVSGTTNHAPPTSKKNTYASLHHFNSVQQAFKMLYNNTKVNTTPWHQSYAQKKLSIAILVKSHPYALTK